MPTPFNLTDLIDVEVLRELAESLWKSSGLPTKIVDPAGRVLVSSGNQSLCLLFHRRHPVSLKRCIESDTEIEELLQARTGGGLLETRCRNGLNHIGLPIVVAGQHLATLFFSQFLYETPDEDVFRQRTRDLGLDEEAYLGALREVPVLDRDRVREVVAFYDVLVRLLTEMGSREAELLESRARLEQSERKFRTLFEGANDAMFVIDFDGQILEVNEIAAERLRYSRPDLQGMRIREIDSGEYEARGAMLQRVMEDEKAIFETVHVAKDGSSFPVEVSACRMGIGGKPAEGQ